tara:strand:- start:1213 stop:2970 length:1758 start_codon:yes stop_codon:yes gene_type:complete
MATPVDQLIVEIKAETAQLRKGLNDVNRQLGRANKTAKSSVMNFGNLAKVFATIGGLRLGGAIAGTAREFQDLEATLKAVTGSSEKAKDAFELIKQFTATTTFQVQNVATAFTTLLNAGITPTSDTMKDFGNIAAAFGKDITQIAQATFNATTGETEMLKQFGIKAKLEGDKITMIFREQETVIDRDSKAIVGFLRNIAQEDFSTALDDRAKTATGAISNLKDAISITFSAIGESGLLDVLTTASLRLKKLAEDAEPAAEIIGRTIKVAFEGLSRAINFAVRNMNLFLLALKIYVSFRIAGFILMGAQSFVLLAKGIRDANIAMLAFNKATKKNLILLLLAGVTVAADKVFDLTGKIEEMLEKLAIETGILNPSENKEIEKSIDDLNASIQEVTDNMNSDLNPVLENAAEFSDQLQQAVTDAANSFTTDFVDSLLQGANALDSFKNFARNIVSQIIAIFLQLEVVNRILKSIFPNFEGTVGTGLFDESASGGTVQKGRPTLVGERGAEIFVPHSGGTIINNMNTKNAMGGNTTVINQSINFATGVVPTVRAEVMKLMPQISEVTKGAVAEAAMRGGNFRRSLQGG